MPVHVDQARDDRLARSVHDVSPVGDRHVGRRADRRDAVGRNHDRPVLDDLVAAHRDQTGAGQRDRPRGDVGDRREPDRHAFGDRCGEFLLRPVDEIERLAQIAAEEIGAQRPVKRRRVFRPVQVVSGVPADLFDRDRLRFGAELDGLRRRDERRDVSVEAFRKGDPLAVGREPELGCRFALDVATLVAAVQFDALERALFAPAFREEHTVGRRAELRRIAAAADAHGVAAHRGDRVEPAVSRIQRAGDGASTAFAIDDGLTVGRKHGLQVMARLGRHAMPLASCRGDDPHRTESAVAPSHVDDPSAVARKRRVELEMVVLARQAPGFSVR